MIEKTAYLGLGIRHSFVLTPYLHVVAVARRVELALGVLAVSVA